MFMIFERIVPFDWLLLFTVPGGKEKSPNQKEGVDIHLVVMVVEVVVLAAGVVGSFLGLAFLGQLFKRSGQQGGLSGKTMVKMRKLLAYHQNLKFFLSILAINNHRSLVLYYRIIFNKSTICTIDLLNGRGVSTSSSHEASRERIWTRVRGFLMVYYIGNKLQLKWRKMSSTKMQVVFNFIFQNRLDS